MPFKKLGVENIVLLTTVIFVLHLSVAGKLSLYIHPRYILFTILMTLICAALLFIRVKGEAHEETHRESKLSLIPLSIVLFFAIILPARSLTSSTVSQRSIDSGSIVTSSDTKPLNTLFAGSSRGLKLSDWARLLQSNDDAEYYVNKTAKISGFLYDADLGTDTVWLARFVLTCCAVDAQPVGIPIRIEGWQAEYQEDQWLEVEGEFKEINVNGVSKLVLVPVSIEKIEQPRNPYAN